MYFIEYVPVAPIVNCSLPPSHVLTVPAQFKKHLFVACLVYKASRSQARLCSHLYVVWWLKLNDTYLDSTNDHPFFLLLC